jgi:hypothetical protein
MFKPGIIFVNLLYKRMRFISVLLVIIVLISTVSVSGSVLKTSGIYCQLLPDVSKYFVNGCILYLTSIF